MFNYDETFLFNRCGSKDVSMYPEIKEKVNLINSNNKFPINPNRIFSKHIVLKTFLGYIPIESITTFGDIFDKTKYLTDDVEWILPCDFDRLSTNDIQEICRLAEVLGRHWNSKKIINSNNNTLKKTKKHQ